VDRHNTVLPLPHNLGSIANERAWREGPLSVMPRLGACPDPEELQQIKEAFWRNFRSEGLVTSGGELEYAQHCRLMDVQKRSV
jgi:hypothetical protein